MGASSITTVPPWCSVIDFTIDKPEPEAARVAGATVVEAGEALEHQLAVLGRDAGSVVVDGELDRAVVGRTQLDRDRGGARGAPRCRAGCGPRAASWSRRPCTRPADTVPGVDGHPSLLHGVVEHELVEVDLGERLERRRALRPRRGGRGRAARSPCPPCARPRRARAARPRASRRARGCAARPRGWCGSTPSGLRSSCDASDTNCRCFCADVSSRSSIAFMVRASRPTSSSVSGSGTRRSIVVPVIDSASWRIASTGFSARPVKYHAASPTSRIIDRHDERAARR